MECKYYKFIHAELYRLFPEEILLEAIKFVVDPAALSTAYQEAEYDTNKYFSHLSTANSEEAVTCLTRGEALSNSREELILICAKLILSLNEYCRLKNVNFEKISNLDSSHWLAIFYFNQGRLSTIFSTDGM